jgi:hypothetical protein
MQKDAFPMRYIMFILLCLLFVLPVMAAQDDDDETTTFICDADFSSVIDSLHTLQAGLTPNDDATDAYHDLSALITELETFRDTCFILPTLPMSRFFTPDEIVSWEYPSDFSLEQTIEDGLYVFATDEETLRFFDENLPQFPQGSYGFGVMVDPMYLGNLPIDIDPDELIIELGIFGSNIMLYPEVRLFNDVQGIIISYNEDNLFVTVIILKMRDDTMVILIGGSSEADFVTLQDLLIEVANSIRYTP